MPRCPRPRCGGWRRICRSFRACSAATARSSTGDARGDCSPRRRSWLSPNGTAAAPSAGAPPPWTHGHHLSWWDRDTGPTDIDNGVLLCTGCHHRVHDDGWEIRIDGRGTAASVWFVPPPWIDADRTPRLGGNARYALRE
ncbi:HNH endonuclease [Microbacterium hominis]|uniref:HNH endonuclease n=1 Tax=Microbacterium hominis TaxID=162426 RepID=UPI0021E0565A|nr:HNH endonuclease [Microbacterium hominis]